MMTALALSLVFAGSGFSEGGSQTQSLSASALAGSSGRCLGTLPTPTGCAPTNPAQGGAAYGSALLGLPRHSRILCAAPKQSGANLFRQGGVWILENGPLGLAAVELLFAPQPASGDQFGSALAGGQGWVAIGAPLANGASPQSSPHCGLVHMYTEKSSGLQHAQLLSPSGAGLLSFFGSALHLEEGRLIVGAPCQMGVSGAFQQGAAWIYTLRDSGWEMAFRFDPPDGHPGGLAGSAVLMMGNLALVGAPAHGGAAQESGVVWVLENRGGVWAQKDILRMPHPQPGVRFGSSLARSGDWLAVGAPGPVGGSGPGGTVHLFFVGPSGINHERAVQAPSHEAREFGRALAPCENGFLVGAPGGAGQVARITVVGAATQTECLFVGEAASAAGAAVQQGLRQGSFLIGEPGGTSSTSLAARRGGVLHADPGVLPSPQVAVGDLTLGLLVCGDSSFQGWTSPVEPLSLWRLWAVPSSGAPAQELQTGVATADGHILFRGVLGFLPAGTWELYLKLTLLGGQPGTSDTHAVSLP